MVKNHIMQNKPENPPVIVTQIEGLNFDQNRVKAYENTSNKILFIVKWMKDEKRDNLCLPVYTVENELIGYIRKEVDKIKQLFSEYSDPVALLISYHNDIIMIDLYFSHDIEYLEKLRKRTELMKRS
jgi:hypothetical protein